MSRSTVTGILAAAVATGGTFTVGYPTGKTRGAFSLGTKHKLSVLGKVFEAPEDMTLSFGTSSVTVTYNGTTTLPSGSRFTFQFDTQGEANPVVDATSGEDVYTPATLAVLKLGSPGTEDADGYCASQSVTSGEEALLNGALVSGGEGVADAPTGRNVVAAWTNAAIITVTGEDMYGNTVVEKSASGTSLAGKKAFKRVTSVTFNANVTGATVGTGDVLGLPAFLPNSAYVLKELEDGAAPTAGTFVAGLSVATKSTATTADVRGTYDPNSSCDGSKAFSVIAALPDPSFLGNDQYAG